VNKRIEKKPFSDEKVSPWFVIIVAIFITSLITANIIAVKLISLYGFVLPAAILIFPGFFCNFIAVLAIWIGQILPPASFWDGQGSYERILGYAPRLLLASFLAYLVGEFANAFVLAKMKIATNGRWLWLRTISSTLIGQGLDSSIFMTLAFVGTIPLNALFTAVVAQWLAKSVYEAVVTPLTYVVVAFLKRKEGLDVYDHDTKFNPLSWSS